MANDSYILYIEGWLFRIQPPTDPTSHRLLLAIHGWTGNQYSMDIFTHKLKKLYWVIFPCAPYPAAGGGFSWIHESETDQKDLRNLFAAAQNLHSRLNFLIRDHLSISANSINLMGFSQGSALALLYSLNYSQERAKIALLSGFIPDGLPVSPSSLNNRSYFIAHGKRDPIVPLDQAYRLVAFIEDSGGRVDYCEAETGHKLGKDCFNRMQDFLL